MYEYFLGQFASVEGKGGGEFYTPTSVVKTLVDMIEPYQGRVYERIIQRLIQFNEPQTCYAYGYANSKRGVQGRSRGYLSYFKLVAY